MKISLIGTEARDKVIAGADYLANGVKATLGSYGMNVLLEKGNRPTNDGYTISAELAGTLEDEFERRGALALHEVASKTNDEVGDATTSSIVLAQAIMNEAVHLLPSKSLVAKKKPSEVLQMIEESKNNVISRLQEAVKPILSEEELISATKVSVEDDNLAQLIGSTQWKIGAQGIIIVEETNEVESSIEIVKGIHLDNGFGTPYIITNEQEQSLEVPQSPILLTNYTIGKEELQSLKDRVFNPLLAEKKNTLILIARAFTSEAIQLCMESAKAGFAIFPINAPYTYQTEIMRDLEAITGATYFDTEERRLEDIERKDIGFAVKLVARRFDAIVTGQDDLEAIAKRTRQLQERLDGTLSDFERKAIEARIAQFKGGFAILKVGAETTFERKYRKDKADDAVNSARLAFQGGTVKGAGLAFKEISDTLNDDDILKKPLLSIYNQIISTAPEGFEIEEWCRDPYLTLVSALKNACSVAGQFASLNGVITTQDPPKCKHE